MITLYHLDQSRSERIIWLMEELGIEYRLEVFLCQPDLCGPGALKAAVPLGRALGQAVRAGEVPNRRPGVVGNKFASGRLVPTS